MKYSFNPTITFCGRCEEALDFYKKCLGGDITFLQRYKDTNMDVPRDYQDKIVHSEFRADGIYFMANDVMEEISGIPAKMESGMIGLSINFEDVAEQNRLFKAMSVGGTVIMPLDDMFWGARYGTFIDAFGVSWEFNCQTESDRA